MRKFLVVVVMVVFGMTGLISQDTKIVNGYKVHHGERPANDFSKLTPDSYEPGKMMIKLAPEMADLIKDDKIINRTKDGFVRTGVQSIDDMNTKFKAEQFKPALYNLYNVSPASNKFRERHIAWGFNLWQEITLEEGVDVLEAVKDYQNLAEVEVAEPILKKVRFSAEPKATPKWTPNDPGYSNQWHYHNTGQQAGTVDCDIDLPEAWEIEKGSSDVIVAIIDGGVEYAHPDLAANMWPGIGPDGNSTVGDDHGSHVAGTVSAVSNNNLGVAGVAGGSGSGDGAQIMSIELFTPVAITTTLGMFTYAADNGAAISQNSWGYGVAGNYVLSDINGIDYFIANGGGSGAAKVLNGGLVVFAAGNDTDDGLWWPGCYSEVVSVAATNNKDVLSYYSNFGDWIDISAPGGEQFVANDPKGVYSTTAISNGSYVWMQGTSMACPHVSGVAALIVSNAFRNGLILDNTDVWDLLVDNVDNIDAQNPSKLGLFGSGRMNANSSLLALQPMLTTDPPGTPTLSSPTNGFTTTDATPTFDWVDNAVTTSYTIQVDDNSNFGSLEINEVTFSSEYTPSSNLALGTYYWRVRATNINGSSAYTSDWTVTIAAPPGTPTLLSPGNGFSAQTPTFDWTDVSGATSYTILIDDDSDFSSPEVDQSPTASTYTPPVALSYATYYWKVVANNVYGPGAYSSTWTIKIENLPPPTNLLAAVNSTDVSLSWTVPVPAVDTFEDGFENHDDFALDFAPWTQIDGDGGETWGITDVTFPNSGYIGSYIIFNPSLATPALTTGWEPNTGSKYAAVFDAVTASAPNDDWLITPQLRLGTGYNLGFYAKTYTATYGLERFKVGVSTTGTNVGDFTIISPGSYVEAPVAWTNYNYDLSAYAGQDVYLAIICVSNDAFVFMIDDVTVNNSKGETVLAQGFEDSTSKSDNFTYSKSVSTGGESPRALSTNYAKLAKAQTLLGYKVYRDGSSIATIANPATVTYDDNGLSNGDYSYYVTATYSGPAESDPSNVKDVTITSGTTQPSVPTLALPADAGTITDATPLFDWNNASGATTYTILVDNDANFSSPEINQSPSVSEYTPGSDLAYGTYNWKVLATNAYGSSAYSATWTVTIEAPPLPPNITVPATLAASATPGNSVVKNLNIDNAGGEDLTYNISINYTSGKDLKDSGGPDAYGYKWKDSDEAGGPVYSWIDISATGTPLTLGDDAYSADLNLGFTFNFYGTDFTTVKVVSNGFLSFTSAVSGITNAVIPTATTPNDLLAPFWKDLDPPEAGNIYYYSDTANSRFIVSFVGIEDWVSGGGGGANTFQVILFESGKIVYQYGTMNGVLTNCTIGIENGTGTVGSQVVYEAAYLKSNHAIQFQATPEWLSLDKTSGTVAGLNSDPIAATCDATDLSLGVYTADLIVTSNDPDEPSKTIAVTFTVSNAVTPGVPAGIVTSIAGSNLVIDWSVAANATSYDVYSADNPYGTFTFEANVSTNQYTVAYTAAKKFYYIVAKNATK